MKAPEAVPAREHPIYLGRAIACLRIERGMKRQDLVATGAVSYPFLAEIENGTKAPSLGKLGDIADALDVAPAVIWVRAEAIADDPRNR